LALFIFGILLLLVAGSCLIYRAAAATRELRRTVSGSGRARRSAHRIPSYRQAPISTPRTRGGKGLHMSHTPFR
jgi:hypothetical protein